jgi:hypothetical protein
MAGNRRYTGIDWSNYYLKENGKTANAPENLLVREAS